MDRERDSYMVVKSNTIIQRSRYELSVVEQRTIAFICSLIQPNSNNLTYQFEIADYAKTCGIEADGRLYEAVKSTLKGLRDKSMWLKKEDGSETTVGWLAKVNTNKRSGKATVELDKDFAPYLLDLKECFTAYGFYNILKMRSQYSIRLFELLKSYSYRGKINFDIAELKKILMVDEIKSYSDFGLFRTKVIDVAIKEINELTDLTVRYDTKLQRRKVVCITFYISEKKPIEKVITYQTKMNER